MIDLTLNKVDRDNFITKVYMKDSSPNYYIQYASGKEEEREFSLHNLNASFLLMESQFMEYKDAYAKRVLEESARATLNKLIEAVLAILGIVITTNLPIPMVVKIILDMIIIVMSLYYQKKMTLVKNASCNSLNILLTAEEFLNNKEQFMIKVKNPKTLEDEDWYLVSLSSIEEFVSAKQLRVIGKTLTDEVKQDESDKTSKMLKKLYDRKENSQC